VLLQASEFDRIFDAKVGRCAYWLEFTRSNYADDLTRSRECIDYGLSLVDKALNDTKDFKFSATYWEFVAQMVEVLASSDARRMVKQYLTKTMKIENRILAEQDLTPKEVEMVKLEEQNDKGYLVKIKDVKTEWKFQVHPDSTKGLDLEVYDAESNISQFDMKKMYNNKEVQDDIQLLIKQGAEHQKNVFRKNTKKDK